MVRRAASPLRVSTAPGVRQFRQKRSAATYAALLRAGAELFAARGYDATQTPHIAARAGVSTGALYRYFTDKRQIFLEVLADHLERAHAEVTEKMRPDRFAGAGTREAIRKVVDVLFALMRRNVELHRTYLAASLTDPEVAELRARYEERERETLAQLIAAVIPLEVVPDPGAAALVIHVAAIEIAGERAGLRLARAARVSDAAVRQALADLIDRYVFPRPVEPPRRRK